MKLYADEGVDQQIVNALRAAGFDVAYAAESGPSVSDDALLAKAAAEGRLLVPRATRISVSSSSGSEKRIAVFY